MWSECRTLSYHMSHVNDRLTSSVYVSFSVGAVAVTLLAVVLSATLSVDSSHTLRHRRALLDGTVLNANDTVLNESDSVTYMTISTVTRRPHKPHFIDASQLAQDKGTADGSSFRNKIRENLGEVPADRVPSDVAVTSRTNSTLAPSHSVLRDAVTVSRDVVTVSASSVSLQDILRQIESLMTNYTTTIETTTNTDSLTTTTTTAAAAAEDDDDNAITSSLQTSSSVSLSHTTDSSLLNLSDVTQDPGPPTQHRPPTSTSNVSSVGVIVSQRVTANHRLPTQHRPPTSTSSVSSVGVSLSQYVIISSNTVTSCHILLWTVSVITICSSIIFLCVWSYQPPCYQSTNPPPLSSTMLSSLVVLTSSSLVHFFESSMEWTYSGLVVEFVGSYLSWSHSWSLTFLLAYWLSYVVGRLICYTMLDHVRPWLVMFSAFLLSLVSTLVMMASTLEPSGSSDPPARDVVMWFSSCVLGLSTSVVVPTSDKYIPSAGGVSMALTVGSSLGQATGPWSSAMLAGSYTYNYIVKVVFASSAGAVICSIALKYIMTRSTTWTSSATSSHFHLLDSSSLEDMDIVLTDEETERLNDERETSLINTPSSSPSSPSLQSFIRNMSSPPKND